MLKYEVSGFAFASIITDISLNINCYNCLKLLNYIIFSTECACVFKALVVEAESYNRKGSPATVGCCDFIILVFLVIYYLLSDDESCTEFEDRKYLLIGIIILSSFIFIRCLSCFCVCTCRDYGVTLIVIINIILLLGALAFFCIVIIKFFSQNDCSTSAPNIYKGMLVMTIYAFLVVILCGCTFSCLVLSICCNK